MNDPSFAWIDVYKRVLPQLSAPQRKLFSVMCAERIRHYYAESPTLAAAGRDALDLIWTTLGSTPAAPDAVRATERHIESLRDQEDEHDLDLLDAFASVSDALSAALEPQTSVWAERTADCALTVAGTAETQTPYSGELEEIEWQRKVLALVADQGDQQAQRSDFAELIDVPPAWLAHTIRAPST